MTTYVLYVTDITCNINKEDNTADRDGKTNKITDITGNDYSSTAQVGNNTNDNETGVEDGKTIWHDELAVTRPDNFNGLKDYVISPWVLNMPKIAEFQQSIKNNSTTNTNTNKDSASKRSRKIKREPS